MHTGDVFEKYRIEGVLGQGAMATVYKARHTMLDSVHALKVLHIQNEGVKARMIQEGKVQSGLRHPNIVSVTDIIDVKGAPGLVMEYIEGPTLEKWLTEYRPSMEEAEALFLGVLSGIERAHNMNLIHRDLKPANVLLAPVDGQWVPKITDFGLAKTQVRLVDFKATMTGVMMGTPAYMAPEQIRDASSVDHRADIFSLGCMLYELMCGVVPFDHEDWVEVLAQVKKGEYKAPESHNPNIPNRTRLAIQAALCVDIQKRVASVAAFRAILIGEIVPGERSFPKNVPVSPTMPGVPTVPERVQPDRSLSEPLPAALLPVDDHEVEPTLQKNKPLLSNPEAALVPETLPSDAQFKSWVFRGVGVGVLVLGLSLAIGWFLVPIPVEEPIEPLPSPSPVVAPPVLPTPAPTPVMMVPQPKPVVPAGTPAVAPAVAPAVPSTGPAVEATKKIEPPSPAVTPSPAPTPTSMPTVLPGKLLINPKPPALKIEGPTGVVHEGELPPGIYRITFNYGEKDVTINREVVSGKTVTIKCAFGSCN